MFSKFECIFNAATVKLEVIVINASFLMRKILTFYKFMLLLEYFYFVGIKIIIAQLP